MAGWGPSMGPTQAELIRQAMPTPVQPNYALGPTNAQNMAMVGATPMGMPMAPPPPTPPPSPLAQYTMAHASMYGPGSEMARAQGLATMQPFANPATAGEAMAQRALGGPSTLGKGLSALGTGMGFIPGAQLAGAGLSFFGQQIGDAVTNNPLTRWGYKQMYGGAIEQMTGMAQLRTGTEGMLQLTGGDVGMGGAGMSATGGLRLAQRFRGAAGRWAEANPEMAEQVGRGDADEGARRYAADLRKLTQMAGEYGLLDAATNVEQIGDVTQKLFKVIGKMAEVTGDPDFRNNLQKIAQMRQFGFTIDQAADATRQITGYQRAGGMSQQQVLGAQNMGIQTMQQFGMAPGVGMVYGPQAQLQARQLAGAYTPIQESLLGGREGIAQRWMHQQAQFASSPAMNMMMGSAMQAGPGGAIGLDPSRLNEMLAGGTTMSGMAGQSQSNIMRIARQMAQQQGRPVQDVMVELMQRQPEIQSQIAQQLGPEGMRMLQMRTVQSLAQGQGLGLHTAAQLVAGGDPQQAQMLTGMMTSPEFYERERERLQQQLRDIQRDQDRERAERRQRREELRDSLTPGFLGYRSVGRGIGRAAHEIGTLGGVTEEIGEWWEARQDTEARERTIEMQREEDRARGIKAVYAQRDINERVVEEMTQRMYGEEPDFRERAKGMDDFERARMRHKTMMGDQGELTGRQIEIAQEARGVGDFASWANRVGYSLDTLIGEPGARSRSLEKRTRKTMDRLWKNASVIHKTRGRTLEQRANLQKNLESALSGITKDGETIDPRKVVNAMQDKILNYAGKAGQEDTMVDFDQMRDEMAQELANQTGWTKDRARKYIEAHKDKFNRMAADTITDFGSPIQKAAFEGTYDKALEAADITGTETLKELQEKFEDAREDYTDTLDEADIIASSELTTEEQEALSGLRGIEDPAVQEAVSLMAALEDKDLSDDERKQINERLRTIRADATKEYGVAKKELEKIRKKGGAEGLQAVGRVRKLMEGGDIAGGELKEALRKGRVGEGSMGILYKPEAIAAEGVRKYGATVEGGKLVMPGATPEGEEAKGIQGQIAALDEMKKQFANFGSASNTLELAARTQIDAARMLGGRVEKVAEEFFKEMNE